MLMDTGTQACLPSKPRFCPQGQIIMKSLNMLWQPIRKGFPGGSVVKNLPAKNAVDLGSLPGSGRSPGGGHSNPL